MVFSINAFHSRTLRLEERKIQLINAAELVDSIIKEHAVLASSGTMPPESARAQALARIKVLRFGENGYFLVFDEHKVLMHPIKTELVGKPLNATQDVEGRQVYLDAIQMAASTGRGFTNFLWSKPGSNQAVHKLAYTTTYKPWNWYIMTGLYVDDLDKAFKAQLISSLEWLVAIGVLLTTLVWLAARSVERSIGGDPEDVVKAAQSIATGDLIVKLQIRSDDETSVIAAVGQMRNALATIVEEVRAGTDLIATTSAQIAAGNMDLSSRTEQQASSLQETAASMEEISSNVHQSIAAAAKASEIAASTLEMAQQGGTVVAEVVDTMAAINVSSNRIVDIISVINSIAFQTNILALNAAVESARAGEYGKGFAVVASEVGALAQRAALAAKEIEVLINDSVSKASAGAELVQKAGTTMRNIVTGVNDVNTKLYSIAATTREQGVRIEKINGAITQIDRVTSQNAALVEEAAAASDALKEQASKLVESVSVFRATS